MFEGVQNHLFELLRKCNFGPKFSLRNVQSCRFEHFESGPKLQFDMWWKINASSCNFGPLSNWSNLQFWSIEAENVDQICIYEVIWTRDSELFQTLFWTKLIGHEKREPERLSKRRQSKDSPRWSPRVGCEILTVVFFLHRMHPQILFYGRNDQSYSLNR